jgi:hypothetical protein
VVNIYVYIYIYIYNKVRNLSGQTTEYLHGQGPMFLFSRTIRERNFLSIWHDCHSQEAPEGGDRKPVAPGKRKGTWDRLGGAAPSMHTWRCPLSVPQCYSAPFRLDGSWTGWGQGKSLLVLRAAGNLTMQIKKGSEAWGSRGT